MYLIAFRGCPWIRLPGAAPFPQLADAIAAAKELFGVTGVPLAILSGPADPRLTTIALSERAYTEVDAITPYSWAGSEAGSRFTVREYAALLATVPIGSETAYGDFPADNSYVITVRAMNPGPAPGAATGAEGVAYDYSAALFYDPESDGGGEAAPIPDSGEFEDGPEPDATKPDPTPGPPASPTAAEIAAGASPVWQWRVWTLANIIAGGPSPAWSDPGPSDFAIGRFGASEPFRLEVQDVGDEAATVFYHGPNEAGDNEAGDPPPAPTLAGVWKMNPATGRYSQYLTAGKPPGETWAADGGRLISVHYYGTFQTPDHKSTAFASRLPAPWVGPVDLGRVRGDGDPVLSDHTDPNTQSAFADQFADGIFGATEEKPLFTAWADATYGAGEPRRWHEPGEIVGGPGTFGVTWDHTFVVSAPALFMGAAPGDAEAPAPEAPAPEAPAPEAAPPKDGCLGSHNSAGYDPLRGEYYLSGDRNRLRLGGHGGRFPGADGGIVTDDAGTGLGAVLEALTGTPCTQLGVGLGVGRGGPAGIRPTVGLFLELGTGGPSPFRIPL